MEFDLAIEKIKSLTFSGKRVGLGNVLNEISETLETSSVFSLKQGS